MHHISTFIVYQERKKTAPNVRLKKYRKKLQSTDSQLPSGIQNPTHRMRSTRKLFYAWEKCLRNIFSLKKFSPPGCCSFRTAVFFIFPAAALFPAPSQPLPRFPSPASPPPVRRLRPAPSLPPRQPPARRPRPRSPRSLRRSLTSVRHSRPDVCDPSPAACRSC